jgi:hypothetical protein
MRQPGLSESTWRLRQSLEKIGAGEGNRTLVFSLEGFRRLNTYNGPSDKSPQNPSLDANDFPALSERGAA